MFVQSKNKRAPTVSERLHIKRVADLQCSLCDAPGPSEVHELKQGKWFLSIALCESCHRGAFMGWHGQKRAWIMAKMDELGALNVTIERLMS
jgi:hypothetical protein